MSMREINRLKEPGIYAIGHVRGLSVRVNDSGGIAYVYRYRIANHGRSVTIGDKKAITLKDAIAKAHEYSIMRINNKDPFLEKKKQNFIEKRLQAIIDIPFFIPKIKFAPSPFGRGLG